MTVFPVFEVSFVSRIRLTENLANDSSYLCFGNGISFERYNLLNLNKPVLIGRFCECPYHALRAQSFFCGAPRNVNHRLPWYSKWEMQVELNGCSFSAT